MKNTKKYFNIAVALAIALFASGQTFADLTPEQQNEVFDLNLKVAERYFEDLNIINEARKIGDKILEEKALGLANARYKQYGSYRTLAYTKQSLSQTELDEEISKIKTAYSEEIQNIK